MALYKRAFHLGSKPRLCFAKYRDLVSLFPSTSTTTTHNSTSSRHVSQAVNSNANRAFPVVDSLALGLEADGVPSKQAEAITSTITEVLNDSLENVAHSFVSKSDMQKSELLQESNMSKFKSEVQTSHEHHFSLLQRETEKLHSDIEKTRSELRYAIDKVIAGQRLDLNLERGRIRDELANQNVETTNLTNKLDREIQELRAQLEATKYGVIKYCIASNYPEEMSSSLSASCTDSVIAISSSKYKWNRGHGSGTLLEH